MFEFNGIRIEWKGHACFKIKTSKVVIYIDPYQVDDIEKADIILITHDHYDHCSPEDIEKLRKDSTVVFAAGAECGKVKPDAILVPGQREEVKNVIIDAVPAYNVGKKFHPKEKKYCGYVVEVEGKRIYHAGDTDVIPEMKEIRAAVALLPVGGTYTMDADEAAVAAKRIECDVAIPMHYGTIIGSKEDAEHFREVCECEVKIL